MRDSGVWAASQGQFFLKKATKVRARSKTPSSVPDSGGEFGMGFSRGFGSWPSSDGVIVVDSRSCLIRLGFRCAMGPLRPLLRPSFFASFDHHVN